MKKYLLFVMQALLVKCCFAQEYKLASPLGKNTITITCNNKINLSVSNNNSPVLLVSDLSLVLNDVGTIGQNPRVIKAVKSSVNTDIAVTVPVKYSNITDHYNQLELIFKGNYSVIFRAYDNGIAYRFVTRMSQPNVTVKDETLSFSVINAHNVIWPYEFEKHPNPMQSHYEYLFKNIQYDSIDNTTVGLPVYFTASNGAKIVFTESDLFDYPNLFLKKEGSISATFPHPILEQHPIRDRGVKIIKEADYIASTAGTRAYPWRLWMIDDNDAGLLTNTLVYQLATPSRLSNTSWIKPGKVVWDWWNANNIYGVDFKSGINNSTYKYYIDFASRFGLPYIMLDEGWTKTTLDILHSNPDINIPELVAYARTKKVNILLWVLWNPLDEKMSEALDLYKSWGVKGIKVDFMARAEQFMVNFYTTAAEACAKRELLIDFHGAYKPTGLNRTYPNVISYEGVHGLENNKWESTITPQHDATIPFVRMMAGPVDFTPGAMKNATKQNFRVVFTEPMSMGTRAHQTGLYIVFESPLQMLADNPSNYLKEPVYTTYLSKFPTTWTDMKVLYAEAGKAVIIARKHDRSWYIGGITDWNGFTRQVTLDFLGEGEFEAEILEDGINADKAAQDYRISKHKVNRNTKLDIKMASGGGYTAIIKAL